MVMYNMVMLIGRLTDDPEISKSDNKDYCHITLAVQRAYKNSDGIYEADFIRCTLWDKLAKRVKEYCRKGDLISVRGQIRTSSYDVNNEKKYSTEVIVERLVFLANKTKTENEIDDVKNK